MTTVLNVAKDFSRSPAGRYLTDGPYSGQAFRDKLLLPALQKNERVLVQLDGVLGLGASFLEEVFGGLVREAGYKIDVLRARLEVSSRLKTYEMRVWQYITDAKPKS